jgi:RNA polymerase sigma factor (sigma-70 family)
LSARARGSTDGTIAAVEPRTTSWTLIDSARQGDARARDVFAERYLGIVRAYFAARWAASTLASEVEDGVQEVFVDCLRDQGALERIDEKRPFRPYLYGVARNVALRFERRKRGDAKPIEIDSDLDARETRLSAIFDRAFAVQMMRDATELQRQRAKDEGGLKLRRVELLELRFQRDLSLADIARQWGEDPARVHHLYADARADFRDALREVVSRGPTSSASAIGCSRS